MIGHDVAWANKIECEIDANKRKWLKHFSQPTMLMSDVCDLGKDVAFCHITQCEEEIPRDMFLYTFGYSCKDLSTLNTILRISKPIASRQVRARQDAPGEAILPSLTR